MITISMSLGLFIIIVVAIAFGAACFGTWASFSHERRSIKKRERAVKKAEQEAHQLQEANIAHSFVLDEREAAVEEKELQLREVASGMSVRTKQALDQSLEDTVFIELPDWEEVTDGSS